jgi:hypothetical protein
VTRHLNDEVEVLDLLPEEAEPRDHLIQFYGRDHQLLIGNVGRFFRVGLRRGEGLLAIASLEHCDAFARELRREPAYQSAVREGRLIFLDAELVLAQSMVEGRLALSQLESTITATIQDLKARAPAAPVRVFGEMVGLLWRASRIDEALELEECWNGLLQQHGIILFCAYPIDRLDQEKVDRVDAVLASHTHVVTARRGVDA